MGFGRSGGVVVLSRERCPGVSALVVGVAAHLASAAGGAGAAAVCSAVGAWAVDGEFGELGPLGSVEAAGVFGHLLADLGGHLADAAEHRLEAGGDFWCGYAFECADRSGLFASVADGAELLAAAGDQLRAGLVVG